MCGDDLPAGKFRLLPGKILDDGLIGQAMKAISLYSALMERGGNRKAPDLSRYGLVEGGIEGSRLGKMGKELANGPYQSCAFRLVKRRINGKALDSLDMFVVQQYRPGKFIAAKDDAVADGKNVFGAEMIG